MNSSNDSSSSSNNMTAFHQPSTATLEWKFEDFLESVKRHHVVSEPMDGNLGPRFKWQLKVRSEGHRASRGQYISVLLCMIPAEPMNMFRWNPSINGEFCISARFKVCMMDAGGNVYRSAGGATSDSCIFKPNSGWGFNNFCPMENLNKYPENLLPGGSLFMKCTIWIETPFQIERFDIGACHMALDYLPSPERLASDLQKLLQDGTASDFVIEVLYSNYPKKLIPVHKAILAARSPVFAAMLRNEVVENRLGAVQIEDFGFDVVFAMLEFMYTGQVGKHLLATRAPELLQIADKYMLEDLRKECQVIMANHLNIDNATETFYLADLVRCQWLKEVTARFIKKKQNEVVKTLAFRNMSKENPKLIEDLFLMSDSL